VSGHLPCSPGFKKHLSGLVRCSPGFKQTPVRNRALFDRISKNTCPESVFVCPDFKTRLSVFVFVSPDFKTPNPGSAPQSSARNGPPFRAALCGALPGTARRSDHRSANQVMHVFTESPPSRFRYAVLACTNTRGTGPPSSGRGPVHLHRGDVAKGQRFRYETVLPMHP